LACRTGAGRAPDGHAAHDRNASARFHSSEFRGFDRKDLTVQTATSDLFNQLFWLLMGGLVSIAAWRDPQVLLPYFTRLSLLFVFLAYCIFSAAWATHPDISIRRSALLLISVYCLLGSITYCRSTGTVMRTIYAAFALALVCNLASLPLPFSFDFRGLFRGVSGDKNFLGVIALLGLFTGVALRGQLTSRWAKSLNLLYLAGWIAILPLTGAKTAISLTVAAPVVALALLIAIRGLRISFLAVAILALMTLFSAFSALTEWVGIEPVSLLSLVVSDVSFTGRDVIWQFIIDEWWTRPLLGFGYGSFWGVGFESPNLSASHDFIRLLTQGHNGYLDILLTLGGLGMLIFASFLGQAIAVLNTAYATRAAHRILATATLVFVVLQNLTESSFARGVSAPWMFLLVVLFILVKAEDLPSDT
jgi:exopolysaccharide production protein ExoQ